MCELNRFYGTVLTFDSLMNVLYTVKQESKELVTCYAVQLSSALKTIKRMFPQQYCRSALDNNRHEQFYKRLNPHIK